MSNNQKKDQYMSDDETLSIASTRSNRTNFINQPVNQWPQWTLNDNKQSPQPYITRSPLHMRGPVSNNQHIYQQPNSGSNNLYFNRGQYFIDQQKKMMQGRNLKKKNKISTQEKNTQQQQQMHSVQQQQQQYPSNFYPQQQQQQYPSNFYPQRQQPQQQQYQNYEQPQQVFRKNKNSKNVQNFY